MSLEFYGQGIKATEHKEIYQLVYIYKLKVRGIDRLV